MAEDSGDVFGQILSLDSKSSTIVFIAVLVFFLLFESVLHVFENACNKRGFKGLVKKLYREFMMMGIVSFVIYVASELLKFPKNKWFSAFNFAHIVILFIGITFLIQAILLVSMVSSRNRTLLAHASTSTEVLLREFVTLHKAKGLKLFMFNHGPIAIPFPELREKIEYKILQHFFVTVYKLPMEFKFANYMCMVLKDYVISLVEVRPLNWLIMSGFVALNFLKISVVDPVYGSACTEYSSTGHIQHLCVEYTLRYAFLVLVVIGLYLLGVLIASEIYLKRLISVIIKQHAELHPLECDIESQHPDHVLSVSSKRRSDSYIDALELLMTEEFNYHAVIAGQMHCQESGSLRRTGSSNSVEESLSDRVQRMSELRTQLQGFREINLTESIGQNRDNVSELSHQEPKSLNVRNRGYSVFYFDRRSSTDYENDNNSNMTFAVWLGHNLLSRLFAAVEHIKQVCKGYDPEDSLDGDDRKLLNAFNHIFAFSQPSLYFLSVELSLLMQCMYIALWATNFVTVAEMSHFPVRWQILLVAPLPVNFFLLKQIIFSSCMLKSIMYREKHISDKICDDALNEQEVTQRLARLLRIQLRVVDPEMNVEMMKEFLKEKFEEFCGTDVVMNKRKMKKLLHSLQISLTDLSIERLFAVIDFDQDGMVSWEDLSRIVFPDLQKRTKVKKRSSISNFRRLSYVIERVDMRNDHECNPAESTFGFDDDSKSEDLETVESGFQICTDPLVDSRPQELYIDV